MKLNGARRWARNKVGRKGSKTEARGHPGSEREWGIDRASGSKKEILCGSRQLGAFRTIEIRNGCQSISVGKTAKHLKIA
jgi:hypothetical protein